MPTLPFDHPEPFAATLGVMLYPGTDEGDRRRAGAFTSQYLAKPLTEFHQAGGRLNYKDLAAISEGSGERLDDLDRRWLEATATGEMFKALFALFNTNQEMASWSNATKLAEKAAAQSKISGSRSSLYQIRSKYSSVAHLWAAWVLRDGKLTEQPEVGNELHTDFQAFLMESEIFRRWGQTWCPKRSKARPPLPQDVWQPPKHWKPPVWQPNWPMTGRVPKLTISDELLLELKPAGRPKSPS